MSLNKPTGNEFVIRNVFFQVFHMLPKEMCLLCSLLPGDDKLAFSVFWEMTPQAEVVRHYFTRSIINSCAQLSYQHAQVNFY
jgi:DIS3-like exonuclease 2